MSTTGGDWKNVAEYDYFDELTPEQTAYEFLRRNEDYVAAYKAAADAPATEHERAALAAQWGLRFRHRSDASGRPDSNPLAASPQPASASADDAVRLAGGRSRATRCGSCPDR